MATPFTPQTAAYKLTHWLDAAASVGMRRFPVDVEALALQVGGELRWKDPIFKVEAASIEGFEGGLFRLDERGWALLYNKQITSPGRIRFTQAHELGHYLVHRLEQDEFACSQQDVVNWQAGAKAKEVQADQFASELLMPMKQFRTLMADKVDLGALSDAASLFGVSLTAAALRWIRGTEESAVLVVSRDDFIDWSVPSDRAFKNGAYIKTKGLAVALPEGSIAADNTVSSNRAGGNVPLRVWFPHAHPDAVAREMKLRCDNFDYTLTLLHISRGEKVWKPAEED